MPCPQTWQLRVSERHLLYPLFRLLPGQGAHFKPLCDKSDTSRGEWHRDLHSCGKHED
jgi:hypothetical protein